MAALETWTLSRQREREKELLFVGNQYRQAIGRYYFAAPGGTQRVLPATLEDLLEDDRYPLPLRHLRRIYPDPVTGKLEWGFLRSGDGIMGVYSLSEAMPIKQTGFPNQYVQFEGSTSYRDWVFAFAPRRGSRAASPPAGAVSSGSTDSPVTSPSKPPSSLRQPAYRGLL